MMDANSLNMIADAIAAALIPLREKLDTVEQQCAELTAKLAASSEDIRKDVAAVRTDHAALRGEFDGITKSRDLMRGEKGDKGDPGDAATMKGERGDAGEQGPQGDRGDPGPAGKDADLGPVLQRIAAIETSTIDAREKAAAAVAATEFMRAALSSLKGDKGDAGERGAPGKDGVGIAGFEIEQKDARTYVHKVIRTDGEVLAAELYVPIPAHVGKWIPERAYKAADETSLHGCTWRAKKNSPEGEPGNSGDWTLIAKQGERGEKGPPGPRGGIDVKR